MPKNCRVCFVFLSITCITACSRGAKHNKLEPVPDILPGILPGYLPLEVVPNSLTLLPPLPGKDSSALALDNDVNLHSLALRGTTRWDLAAEDAKLKFPEAAGTFSCAINAPITGQQTPQLQAAAPGG